MQQQHDSLVVHLAEARRESEGLLHFNQRLPLLADRRGPLGSPEIPFDNLHPRRRMAYARMVLRLNHGTADIELTRPLETVDHLLASLQILCGLALLAQPDRYTLFYRCGRLFNPIEVGYEIASLIQDAFYVDMELNFTASLGLVHSRFRVSKPTAPRKHAKDERESGRRL